MKQKLVVFTGAGISAESGLKTFRDSGGLWEGYDVQQVATPRAWQKDMELVLRFYNERRQNVKMAQPNPAHWGLVDLEEFFDVQIITQNIDDLHERAGSTQVLHLHGEIFKMRSVANPNLMAPIYEDIQVGDLAPDGQQWRPHIVWFEEEVPAMGDAISLVEDADIFVVIGTSLVVYPAAGLIHYLPHEIPVFVIDKHVPKIQRNQVTYIEQPASEGIQTLKDTLLASR